MTNTIKLSSPWRYPERILLFGGGGVGKSNTVLNILDHMTDDVVAHIMDCDYSGTYDRAIEVDYPHLEDRVKLTRCSPEWLDFITTFEAFVTTGDPTKDWIAVDPFSSSYEWVQDYVLTEMYGDSLMSILFDLKKQYDGDAKSYNKAKANLMNWDLVKKEYNRVWRALQKWNGNLILVSEAKEIGNQEKDAEVKMLYGPLGFKPAGQASTRHATSTTLFLDHPSRGVWRATTIKDRNRLEMDKEVIEDFGMDYLAGVAGWEPVGRKGKK